MHARLTLGQDHELLLLKVCDHWLARERACGIRWKGVGHTDAHRSLTIATSLPVQIVN